MIELSAWGTILGITLEPGPELSPMPMAQHQDTRAQARELTPTPIPGRKAASNRFAHI